MDKGSPHMWRLAGRYSAVGIEIFLAMAISTFVGDWIDGKLDTSPIFVCFGAVVGFGAVIQAIRRTVKMAKHDLNEPPQD